jgi:hypothetical protein
MRIVTYLLIGLGLVCLLPWAFVAMMLPMAFDDGGSPVTDALAIGIRGGRDSVALRYALIGLLPILLIAAGLVAINLPTFLTNVLPHKS